VFLFTGVSIIEKESFFSFVWLISGLLGFIAWVYFAGVNKKSKKELKEEKEKQKKKEKEALTDFKSIKW